jgi:hypothetical protein
MSVGLLTLLKRIEIKLARRSVAAILEALH